MNITTYQAGKILGISRKEVVEILKEGDIRFTVKNGNYMLNEDDLLAFKRGLLNVS